MHRRGGPILALWVRFPRPVEINSIELSEPMKPIGVVRRRGGGRYVPMLRPSAEIVSSHCARAVVSSISRIPALVDFIRDLWGWPLPR